MTNPTPVQHKYMVESHKKRMLDDAIDRSNNDYKNPWEVDNPGCSSKDDCDRREINSYMELCGADNI